MITITASPSTVTAKTTILQSTITGAQPTNPIYSWSLLAGPSVAAPAYSDNGTSTAGTTTVMFNRAGGYLFLLTVTDGGNPFGTAVVDVQVQQTFTLIGTNPGQITVGLPGHQGFTATAFDQFLQAMAVQPAFTWTVTPGGGTITSSSPNSGFYTPPGVAGNATITAASGGKTKTASVTITTGNYPTVATPAAASPSTVTNFTSALTVRGASSSGESNLTYTWSESTGTVLFTNNGTNAAQQTTAIFSATGSYTMVVTITDRNGLTVTSSVVVTVTQTFSSIIILPFVVNLLLGATQQFSAVAYDQFHNIMSSPAFAWSISAGTGSIDSSTGIYTAPGTPGSATVEATGNSIHGFQSVTITSSALPLGIFWDSATGTLTIRANAYNNTVNLSVFTNIFGVQTVSASLVSTDSSGATVLQQSMQITLSQMNYIYYYGQAGFNNSFTNATPVSCTAYGGINSNFLTGGSGNDVLYAGGGNNQLKGMDGNDTLVGGPALNYLYGGTGSNTLIPGSGLNHLFPNG